MNHVEYFFRPRSERGALDAYGFRCSCGTEQTTSLELEQRQLAAAHLDWHAAAHTPALKVGPSGVRAECSCGWGGMPRYTDAQAYTDHATHKENQS